MKSLSGSALPSSKSFAKSCLSAKVFEETQEADQILSDSDAVPSGYSMQQLFIIKQKGMQNINHIYLYSITFLLSIYIC